MKSVNDTLLEMAFMNRARAYSVYFVNEEPCTIRPYLEVGHLLQDPVLHAPGERLDRAVAVGADVLLDADLLADLVALARLLNAEADDGLRALLEVSKKRQRMAILPRTWRQMI
jgi:hypothetical protein